MKPIFYLGSILFLHKILPVRRYSILLLLLLINLVVKAQNISYSHQNKTLEEIQKPNIQWKKFNKTIYKGIDNGVYWFKIEIDKKTPQILHIPESHVSRAKLYYQDNEIIRESNTRYITFKLNPKNNKTKTYFLKVNCLLEARIPIKITAYNSFYKSEMKNYITIGIYIGIVFCTILLNLISYITLKNITYLHYVFMVIGLALNAFYKDGIITLIFGLENFHETQETFLICILVISAIFFTSSYLSLNQNLPKLKKIGVFVVVISLIVNFIYQFTLNFTLFIITNVLFLLALNIFWFSGVLLWKKLPEARFFTIAYGLPLLFAHDYYISPHIGIHVLDLPLAFYKTGLIFEMLVFTYAIMYQSKRITKENIIIRQKLIDFTEKLKIKNSNNNKETVPSEELIEEYKFTIREIEVLKKVSDEKTNKKIASELFISENTVKYHIRNILQKLEVKNRKAASKKYLNLLENK